MSDCTLSWKTLIYSSHYIYTSFVSKQKTCQVNMSGRLERSNHVIIHRFSWSSSTSSDEMSNTTPVKSITSSGHLSSETYISVCNIHHLIQRSNVAQKCCIVLSIQYPDDVFRHHCYGLLSYRTRTIGGQYKILKVKRPTGPISTLIHLPLVHSKSSALKVVQFVWYHSVTVIKMHDTLF